ncbi:MAG: rhamnulose-1-phosphate aldolase [Asgard group archaeon]|nr:rhamnulose-1-phosphate aldolase [Asgard group archaeon]
MIKESFKVILDVCSEIGQLLHEKNWAEGNGGNLSIRIDLPLKQLVDEKIDDNNQSINLRKEYPNLNNKLVLVKGSGKRMRDIKKDPENNLMLGLVKEQEFSIVWPFNCQFEPTSELSSHLLVQDFYAQHNPKINTLLHTHPTELITLSFLSWIKDTESVNKFLKGSSPGFSIFISEGIGFSRYLLPSSTELAEETLMLMKNHRIVLWEKHGVICAGESLVECYDLIDITNKAAAIYLSTRPDAIKMLTDEDVKEINEKHSLK